MTRTFLAEVGIRAVEPQAHAMGAEVLDAQDAADLALADAPAGIPPQALAERGVCPDVPQRDLGWVVARHHHQLTTDFDGDRLGPPAPLAIVESGARAACSEAVAPFTHRLLGEAEGARDLGVALPCRRCQYDAGAVHQASRGGCATRQSLQPGADRRCGFSKRSSGSFARFDSPGITIFKPGTNFRPEVLVRKAASPSDR